MRISGKKLQILVTGGAGFIGSNLVDRLIELGHSVQVIDNLSGGHMEFLRQHCKNPNFEFQKVDVRETKKIQKVINPKTDLVFHLAANSDISKGIEDPTLDFEQTIVSTFSLLQALQKLEIKKIFYASGSGVYGDRGQKHSAEGEGPYVPVSMYGASKMSAEALICAFCSFYDMQAWIVRPANITGPRATHGVTYDFVQRLLANPKELRILGDGRQSKAYLHVADVLDAFLLILGKADDQINIFNISSDTFITVNEIAKLTVSTLGLKNVAYSRTGGTVGWKGDVAVVRLNNSRLNKLGWKPKYSSKEAVAATIECLLHDQRKTTW